MQGCFHTHLPRLCSWEFVLVLGFWMVMWVGVVLPGQQGWRRVTTVPLQMNWHRS